MREKVPTVCFTVILIATVLIEGSGPSATLYGMNGDRSWMEGVDTLSLPLQHVWNQLTSLCWPVPLRGTPPQRATPSLRPSALVFWRRMETANQVDSLLREHTSGKNNSLFPVSLSIRNIATDSPNVNNDKLTNVFVCGGCYLRFGGSARWRQS